MSGASYRLFTLPLYSKLRRLIEQAPMESALGMQWHGWLEGQCRHGLSQIELDYSGVHLLYGDDDYRLDSFGKQDLLDAIKELLSDVEIRIGKRPLPSVIRFDAVNEPRLDLHPQQKPVTPYDPAPVVTHQNAAYDFNIVRVWRKDMLGQHDIWMVLNKDGRPWRSRRFKFNYKPFFRSMDEAFEWCRSVARTIIPSTRTAWQYQVKWSSVRLTGGDSYREWLIRLPHLHMDSVFRPDAHFALPNLLMHLRTSIYTVGARKMLLIEELQSDYNQAIFTKERREGVAIEDNPFQTAWVELGLRVGVLLACRYGLEGVAVSSGSMHDIIYNRVNKGRATFYDVKVAKALQKLGRALSAEYTSASITAKTQHYEAISETQTLPDGTTRALWMLAPRFVGGRPINTVFNSAREALDYKERVAESLIRATVPVIWMDAATRVKTYKDGLPVLGAV